MQGPTRRITIINGAWVVLGVYLGCVMCKNASSLHSPHWCLVTGYLHLALCYFKQHHLVPLMTGLRKKPCILWCQNWVCLEIRWISCWLDVDFQYFDCCLVVYYAFKTSAKYEWIFINIPSCLYRSSPHVHACLCVYIYIYSVPAFKPQNVGWIIWSPHLHIRWLASMKSHLHSGHIEKWSHPDNKGV